MAIVQHSVSLDDAEASRDELEALRGVMRHDEPFPDEPPALDADEDPWEFFRGPLTPGQLDAPGWAED